MMTNPGSSMSSLLFLFYLLLSSPLFLSQMHQRCDSLISVLRLIYCSICVSVHKCVRFVYECVLVCQCVPSLSRATGITRY